MRLAHVICKDTNDGQVTTIVWQDLYRMTLRAIVIGVAALSYHGWGFQHQKWSRGGSGLAGTSEDAWLVEPSRLAEEVLKNAADSANHTASSRRHP